MKRALKSYRVQKSKSKCRNIEFKLTFDQWYHWWLSNGIDKQTHISDSRDGNALCMCRINDAGAYELDNIYCTTRTENSRDARKVDPRSGREKGNKHADGRPVKTPLGSFESIVEAALAMKVHTSTIVRRCKRLPNEYSYIEEMK